MRHLFLTLALFISPLAVMAQQGGAPSPEARMRETLKKVMTQLRDAQAAQVAAQAAQAEADAKNQELTAKLDELNKKFLALTKQSNADKDASEKTIDTLKSRVSDREREIARLNEALGKWKDGFQKAADLSITKEKERAEAVSKAAAAESKASEYKRKNLAMYEAASEVLDRYKKFSLGTALLAREPFVGTMRVKLQGMVTDMGDKLDAQRIKPSDAGTVESKAAAPAPGKDAKPQADHENAPPSKP